MVAVRGFADGDVSRYISLSTITPVMRFWPSLECAARASPKSIQLSLRHLPRRTSNEPKTAMNTNTRPGTVDKEGSGRRAVRESASNALRSTV